MRRKLRDSRLLKGALSLTWVGTLGWLTLRLADQAVLPLYDFIAFWSAGRLQLAGNNPYSAEQLYALQRAVGSTYDIPLMFWNPPWTLLFMMPFALLNFSASRVVWLWLSLALVLVCTDVAWRLYGGSPRHRWLARVVGFTFFPTLVSLYLGQIGPLILAGVVGFLHFEERRQWWLAGAATLLIAIKPHLLYLFWIALFLWALDRRRWSVLLGSMSAGLLATGIPLLFNPALINQYLTGIANHPPFYWITPTLGTVLRMMFGWEKTWLSFVPPIVGASWFLLYWRQQRQTWVWAQQMPVLLLVSLFTASYQWSHDQVVLLPALVQATDWVAHSGRRVAMSLTVVFCLAISVLALADILPPNDFWRIWVTPALLLGYLILRRQNGGVRETGTVEIRERLGVEGYQR